MSLPADERYLQRLTAHARLARPDNVELTLEITLTTAEWRHLMRQLPADGSAAGQLGLLISSAIGECAGKVQRRLVISPYAPAREDEAHG